MDGWYIRVLYMEVGDCVIVFVCVFRFCVVACTCLYICVFLNLQIGKEIIHKNIHS